MLLIKLNYFLAFVSLALPEKSLLFLQEALLTCGISIIYEICVCFMSCVFFANQHAIVYVIIPPLPSHMPTPFFPVVTR